jgi:carbamate kinase
MRSLVILVVIVGVGFAYVKSRSARETEKKLAEQERATEKLIQKQAVAADAQRAEAQRTVMVSFECDTAINNRQVLHDAIQRGATVVSLGGGQAPRTPEEMRSALDGAQQFIDQNCAAAVAARRGPGGAYCSQPHMRGQLVCR